MCNTIWCHDLWFPKLRFTQSVAYFLILLKYHWVTVRFCIVLGDGQEDTEMNYRVGMK